MKRKITLTSALLFTLAASVPLVPGTGCVSVAEEGKRPAIANHVADWRDEVIYQVLVDRFANGDVNNDFLVQPGALARYQGGDWRGLIDHLDYFESLGVTTLWISPIVRNVETDADVDAYHGYWQQDLYDVNPHFGDIATLRELTAALHKRGMKVVLDIVTNHMGQVFFYDMNMNGKPDIYVGGTGTKSPVTRVTEYDPDYDPRGIQAETSLGIAGRAPVIFINDATINRVPPAGILGKADGYHGLGRIISYDDPRQVELGDFPGGLKDVATELPEVRAVMIDAFSRWIEEVDLDGFRIDTVKHVEHDFWKVFTKGVRDRVVPQGKSNFFMFGEAFDGNDALLGSYTQKGELDSVFYFSQHFQVFHDVFQMAHDAKSQSGTKKIETLWADKKKNYGNEPQENAIGIAPYRALVNFMDNHDRPRFLFDAKGDVPALRNALTFLMMEEGIPCLYYGTEQDFAGGNDPANRENIAPTGYATTGDTFVHFSKLARIRKAYPAIRRGDTTVRYSSTHVGDEGDAGIFAFERSGGDAGDAYALVVVNSNARHPSSTVGSDGKAMATGATPGSTLVDVLDPKRSSYVVAADGSLDVSVPAQKTLVLVPSTQIVAE
ncbi:MAG: alpha-amylase family glycosyl hydrolase [Polyangiaceae bacterium]